jgi:hypothetical protein
LRLDVSVVVTQVTKAVGKPLVPCDVIAVDSQQSEMQFNAFWAAAQAVAFTSIVRRAQYKLDYHGHALTPWVVSTEGGILPDADGLIPQLPLEREGRSYCRQKLSCCLLRYAVVRRTALFDRLSAIVASWMS